MEEEQTIKSEEDKKSTRTCPYCKEPYKTKVGFSNWKNLFRKPTIDDWITLFILIMLFAAAYAYTTETKQCRETLQNLDKICIEYAKSISNTTYTETSIQTLVIPSYLIEQPNFTTTNTTINTTTNDSILGGENISHA